RSQCRRLGLLGCGGDNLGSRLWRRPRPRLKQPRGTDGCGERHNDAGQQQRPPTGHADCLNGRTLPRIIAAVYPPVSASVNRSSGEIRLARTKWIAVVLEHDPEVETRLSEKLMRKQ